MRAVACWALLVFCLSSVYAETFDPNRFEKTILCPNLVQPMELEIAPDGKIFLIELGGIVKLLDPASGVAEIVAKLEVTTAQENGLIGIALDPKFAENQLVYLQYSPPDFSGQRISRFRFTEGKIDLSSELCLFTYEEQRRECCHHAGSMEFGPDGNLYIGTGDNTNPFNDSQGYAPIDERPGREPWDAQRSAGNTKSYNGKVLRIRPTESGYAIPDGNLFPKDGSIGHPEIFVMGCRNPWRISVDQRTGFLYWGDVGPDAGGDNERGPRGYDEVNQARTAGNHGWPYFIGNNRAYSMVNFATGEIGKPQDPDQPMNRSVNNTGSQELPPTRAPLFYYPAGESKEFPEVGTGGRTACAGPVYYFNEALKSDRKFPSEYDSTLFAFEWSRNWIVAAHLDAQSNLVRLERFLPSFSFIRPVDLEFDAQGSLYVIEYGETWGVNADAKLVRVDYVRGNRSPVAVAKVENNIGREPLTVKLDGQASNDKDGDSLSYRWRAVSTSGNDPAKSLPARTLGESAVIEATFDVPGVYTVELEVKDPAGATNVTSLPIVVGNARPTVQFLAPKQGDFFSEGELVEYQLLIRDVEDGTSDFDEADKGDLPAIEASAPSRTYVQPAVMIPSGGSDNSIDPPGLALMRKSDCFNCHAVNRPLVGPMFVEIANKYRDQPHQLDASINRVIQGSTGVWGKVAMLPHSQHSREQVQQMVEYVLSTKADAQDAGVRGLRNRVAVPKGAPGLKLEATYSDLGRGDVPALSGSASVTLRSRRVQAEAADQFRGTQVLGSDKAEGQKFMGAIEHDGFLKFTNVSLEQVSKILVRVASAGAGGEIEIHYQTADGPLLGKTSVEVNGDWTAFYEKSVELNLKELSTQTAQPDEKKFKSSRTADVFVVFKNAQNRGGLMNLDCLEFQK